MSDRDGNDHQSMPCGSVSSGLRRWRGKGGCTENNAPPPMQRMENGEIERGVEMGGLGREIGREIGDETDGDAE